MFSYIKGTLQTVNSLFAVVEAGGIGYKINMPFRESSALTCGDNVKIYTYTHIREDVFELYGFSSEETLRLFELLISVSGVGPKAATAILNTLTPSELVLAVSAKDHKTISKSPGIGTKTAQRIVLDLADKLKGFDGDVADSPDEPALQMSGSTADEAVSALVALGYSQNDARMAVSKVKNASSLEEIIRLALKEVI